MSQTNEDKKGRKTRSLALVLMAWVFIGGQALLAAGSVYSHNGGNPKGDATRMPWELIAQGSQKMRLVATQAQPDILGNVAVFLAVANVLGIIALGCGLLSWSRSKHRSGKLTIAVATAIVLINSLLNLPYA